MSLSEFAKLQAKLGTKVVARNGRFWRQVRPFFYRPILPVEEFDASEVKSPQIWPCASQYAVATAGQANSTMDFVMLDEPQSYALEIVGSKRRSEIKRASRDFQIRPLQHLQELKDEGYRSFLSFYDRTNYSYLSARTKKRVFDRWAETLFRERKAILLGGYGRKGLVAVSCGHWVNSTLINATVFCETDAMQRGVGELLFHELRQIAANQPRIREIFVRSYKGGNSQDRYYIYRGCKVIQKPARLEMPRTAHLFLRLCLPRQYELLMGAAYACRSVKRSTTASLPEMTAVADSASFTQSATGRGAKGEELRGKGEAPKPHLTIPSCLQ